MKSRWIITVLPAILLAMPGRASAQDPVPVIEVTLDIKPGSCPNPINVRSNGRLPAAVLGSEAFDVSTIDVNSLLFEGVAALKSRIEDVAAPTAFTGDVVYHDDCGEEGPDGYPDLSLQFGTQEMLTAIEPVVDGEVRQLTLIGTLLDGTPIAGMDVVSIKKKTTDFDEDGEVGFKDFISFARQMGRKRFDMDYDERFDLDDDGDVTFADFVAFVHEFAHSHRQRNGPGAGSDDGSDDDAGNSAGGGNGKGNGKGGGAGKLAHGLPTGVNGAAGIALIPLASGAGEEIRVAVQAQGAVQVGGYALELGYDPRAVVPVAASSPTSSVFEGLAESQSPAVQEVTGAGEMLLADALAPDSWLPGDVTLAVVTFRVIDPGLPARLSVLNASLADGDGLVNTLAGAELADARSGPTEYGLERNVPNPFNPVTQIGYQIPQAGHVSLTVYNVLGQRVRVLVDELQQVGSYRITWDGSDDHGRGVSSGIYALHMKADRYNRTMKMLLLK